MSLLSIMETLVRRGEEAYLEIDQGRNGIYPENKGTDRERPERYEVEREHKGTDRKRRERSEIDRKPFVLMPESRGEDEFPNG